MIFIVPHLYLLVPQANSSLPGTKTVIQSSPSCTPLFPTSIFDHLCKDRKKDKDVAGQKFLILWVSLWVCLQTLVGSCTPWPPYCSSVACLSWQENCNLQFANSLSKLPSFVLGFLMVSWEEHFCRVWQNFWILIVLNTVGDTSKYFGF